MFLLEKPTILLGHERTFHGFRFQRHFSCEKRLLYVAWRYLCLHEAAEIGAVFGVPGMVVPKCSFAMFDDVARSSSAVAYAFVYLNGHAGRYGDGNLP